MGSEMCIRDRPGTARWTRSPCCRRGIRRRFEVRHLVRRRRPQSLFAKAALVYRLERLRRWWAFSVESLPEDLRWASRPTRCASSARPGRSGPRGLRKGAPCRGIQRCSQRPARGVFVSLQTCDFAASGVLVCVFRECGGRVGARVAVFFFRSSCLRPQRSRSSFGSEKATVKTWPKLRNVLPL